MGFPEAGMKLTHILVVADIDRARTFYADGLGAEVYREYGGGRASSRDHRDAGVCADRASGQETRTP